MTMRAFTLIETLIYTAIFTMLVAGAFVSAETFKTSAERTERKLALSIAADDDIERAIIAVRNADAVLEPVPNASSSALRITTDRGETQIETEDMLFERSESPEDPDHLRITVTHREVVRGIPLTVTLSRTIYLAP